MACNLAYRRWAVAISIVGLLATPVAVLPSLAAERQSPEPQLHPAVQTALTERLKSYLAQLSGGRGRPTKVAQGGSDDLLTAPSSPAPAPKSSDDLLTPSAPSPGGGGGDNLLAPGGGSGGSDNLLAPGGGGSQDLLKAPSAPKESEEARKKREEQEARRKAKEAKEAALKWGDPHGNIFAESSYPSASQCQPCHTQIYREWSMSSHAYASISPMFHKFEQTINDLSSGTVRSFCVRCHQTVGTQRGETRWEPLWNRSQVAREGVTCITCHRISQEFGKTNGQRIVQPGDIRREVTGTARGGSKLKEVLANKEGYRVATDPNDLGTPIHLGVLKFEQIGKSQFCVACHQVAVHPGIKLEVVWDQYRAAPAAKNTTCQDCHMGRVPGVAAGYERGPSAIVTGQQINPNRRHSNHAFFGPGYPITHPGLFPHNPKAADIDIQDWLKFNWRANWGERRLREQDPRRRDQGPVPQTLGRPDRPRGCARDRRWRI